MTAEPDLRVDRIPPGAEGRVLEAAALFDHPPRRQAVRDLLGREDHHLLLAYLEGTAAGFALAHELPRLDGPGIKILLYEIGTAPRFRRRGVARALVEALQDLARGREAISMFAITEEGNRAAMALYASTGAVRPSADEAVVEWRL